MPRDQVSDNPVLESTAKNLKKFQIYKRWQKKIQLFLNVYCSASTHDAKGLGSQNTLLKIMGAFAKK